jgi:hypothetical protein
VNRQRKAARNADYLANHFGPNSSATGRVLGRGLSTHFWINFILTLLGWLPGSVHALWLIVKRSPKKTA